MSIFTVNHGGSGRLALVRRPPAQEPAAAIEAWTLDGFGMIVSLLEPDEAHALGLSSEAELCRSAGLDFIDYPIADRGLPQSQTATLALVNRLAKVLEDGGTVGIHCRASIGRSGLLAACLLVRHGFTTGKAFARISQARGLQCPDTADQIAWVEGFESYLAALPADPFTAAAPGSAAPR